MATRIISGIVGAILLIGILVFLPPVATTVATFLIGSLALCEFYYANCKENVVLLALFGLAFGSAIFFTKPELTLYVLALSLMFFLILAVVCHKKISFRSCSAAFFGMAYVFVLLKHLPLTRYLNGGKVLVFAPFIGAFMTDIGAYFTGCFLGKHKLCPEISPKKTVEGAVGGVVVATASFAAFAAIGGKILNNDFNLVNAIITGLVLSVVSQFGDLGASVIKREIGIKDYGKIMPGHGGALDRFDSVLFTAPVFYCLNLILPVFVIK